MEFIQIYFAELWILLLEMAPWLMLGLIFAGLLKVYFPQQKIDRYLGKPNFKSALNAALLGVPMPLCSCGVIPTAISFYRNGASKGATNSFLISTPQTGVDSIFATYSMLGWPFAILRPVIAFVTGVTGGVLTNWLIKEKPAPVSKFANFKIDTQALGKKGETCNDVSCDCHTPKTDRRHSLVRAADYAFVELLQDIGKWLIIGFLAAALLSVLLPNDFFSRFTGYGFLEILVVLAASVPLYICATGSIPIAAVLLMKGVSPGAALVFLMAGPATNVATITVLGKTMGKKSLAIYLATITGGAILFGLLTNWLIPVDFIMKHMSHNHAEGHQMLPQWLELMAALVLVMSLIGGYLISLYKKRVMKEENTDEILLVEGMSCSHCEASVQNNLMKLDGITSVKADNRSGTVYVSGTKIDLNRIREVVDGLGYKFKGKKSE